MSPVNKKGKTIHSEGREIIENIIKICDEELRQKQLSHNFHTVRKTVPTCTLLLPIIKEKIAFAWERELLRLVLRNIPVPVFHAT
ncbi:hypothetical protein C0J52_28346 [Blattella germanica]|nr:hypothetical protein C0J52_28346 [Blattella germanica]